MQEYYFRQTNKFSLVQISLQGWWPGLIVLLGLWLGVSSSLAVAPPGNLPRQYASGGLAVNYQLYLPINYSSTSGSYPLVIFLHGNGEGEAGDAIVNQPTVNNGNQLWDNGQYVFLSSANQATFPCFMALVSRGKTNDWPVGLERDDRYLLIGGMIDQLIATYPLIDRNRVIITGLSGGGGDTMLCAIGNPNRFAAAVPICATTPKNTTSIATMGTMATWFFHADNDPTVSKYDTIHHVTALRAQGARPIFTHYDTGGHGIWGPAYSTPSLIPWIAAQRKGMPVQASPAVVSITAPTTATTWTASTSPLAISGATSQLSGVSDPLLTQVQWYVNNANTQNSYLEGTYYNTTTGTVPAWSTGNIGLTTGSNLVEVVAGGRSWNTTLNGKTYYTATVAVNYQPGGDTVAPGLNSSSVTPVTNTTVTTASVTFNGTATDNVGLQSVTCKNVTNGNALTTVAISGTSASWSVTVPLVSGGNVIEITCKDSSNNTSTPVVQRTIIYTAPASGWSTSNIGGATPAGTYTLTGTDAFSITAGGSSLWWANTNAYFIYQTAQADCAIEARVKEIGYGGNGSSKGGILIRDGTGATANYAFLGKTADGFIHFYSENGGLGDSSFSIGASSTYYWIRLVRVGNTITAFTAADNNGTHGNWISFASRTVSITNPTIGLVVCRNDTASSAITCNLDHVAVTTSGWLTSDIGGATPAGSYTLSGSNAFSINASGSSLWGANTNAYFIYQAAQGDCDIEARVKEIGYGGNGSSKAGILIRDGTGATSNYAFLGKTADGSIHFYSENAGLGDSNFTIGSSTYYWIRLVRVGNTITSYTATDNGNGTHGAWTQFFSRTVSISNPTIGLVVCRNDTVATSITCNLDYVTVNQ
jgi:poly(3-hydroxybutyrate) depolymerase